MKTNKKQLTALYNAKGLGAVKAFLKRNKIEFTEEVQEFGLHTNKGAVESKKNFLASKNGRKIINFHYYSRGLVSNGYHYNAIRGITIFLV